MNEFEITYNDISKGDFDGNNSTNLFNKDFDSFNIKPDAKLS
jgi:hypothetical protein